MRVRGLVIPPGCSLPHGPDVRVRRDYHCLPKSNIGESRTGVGHTFKINKGLNIFKGEID